MELNLNEIVFVKLTDHGRAIHKANHERIFTSRLAVIPYEQPKEDAEGFSTWQLWGLMEEFGQHMGLGKENCFDLTIRIGNTSREIALEKSLRRCLKEAEEWMDEAPGCKPCDVGSYDGWADDAHNLLGD